MNTEKQRITIAEACGWTKIGHHEQEITGRKPTNGFYEIIPDYLNDLNAMHEAEEVLLGDQRIIFLDELLDVLGIKLGPGGWDMDLYSVWQMTRATAEQRAEAFLRIIGKWAIDHP